MNSSGDTGPVKLGIEIYVCLDRLGHPIDTDVVTDLAIQLIENGWVKSTVYWSNPTIEAAIEAVTSDLPAHGLGSAPPDYQHGRNGEVPDPALTYSPTTLARMKPTTSNRKPTKGGVQWNSEWVDPNNTTLPEPGLQRAWSGWHSLNANQLWVLKVFTGEKGRYTLGVQSVINYIKKHASPRTPNRKHIKPHYLMHSLSRRGLITEIDRDVWILAPRGEVYVREILGLEPTPKHDSVDTVKAGA